MVEMFCCVVTGNSSAAGGRSEDSEAASHRGESAVSDSNQNCRSTQSEIMFVMPATSC